MRNYIGRTPLTHLGHDWEDLMIVTTTNTIDGHTIREYCGIVFGEVITGVNVFRDIGASFRDIFGGRSQG